MLSPSPPSLSSLAMAVRDAARRAGDLALPYYRAGAQTAAKLWYKGHSSPVTEADIALDTFLKNRLSDLLPQAGWLSEETADDPARLGRSYVWIVDPIDGTRAFASGHPDWAISIALVRDGKPVLGVLYAPTHDRLYEARPGEGAWCNGERLQVSEAEALDLARVTGPKPLMDRLERRMGAVERLPKVPSLALRLARVAEGSIDVGLVSSDSHDWDLAGADLILHETGGLLTDLRGEPVGYNRPDPIHGELVATSEALHPETLAALRR